MHPTDRLAISLVLVWALAGCNAQEVVPEPARVPEPERPEPERATVVPAPVEIKSRDNAYSLRLDEIVGSYDETPMVMIRATITAHSPAQEFYEGAMFFHAAARDKSKTVSSFMAFSSSSILSSRTNHWELYAFFTTDAFEAFPGLFDLDFGYGGRAYGTFENVDIAALTPLEPLSASLGIPSADNAWLGTLRR